jgi:hypothetical protein
MQKIEFANVDEIIEMIVSRFENAHLHVDESLRNQLRDEFNTNELTFDFDELHNVIEINIRTSIAMNFAMRLFMQHEFDHVVSIVRENTFHEFDVLRIFDDERITKIATIRVNDDLSINVEMQ